MEKEKPYQLQSTSDGFQSRSKDIFANLDSIADTKSKIKRNDNDDYDEKRQHQNRSRSPPSRDEKRYSKEFKGRESIFRTPNESGWPPSRSDDRRPRSSQNRHRRGGPSKVPDHVINPKKYTKYDLSDVSKEQMTDRSNTRAAFDFLNQLKTRNENEDDEKCQEVDEGKISFKKPIKKSNISSEASSSNVVKDGVKRVMPECVVGMKRSLEKSKTEFSSTSKKSKSSKNKIALSHLDDDEEDSD